MNIDFYRDKLKTSRKDSSPVIIKKTNFKLPSWEEVLKAFDTAYNKKFHDENFIPNKESEKIYGSIMEDEFYYFSNMNPSETISSEYINPVNNFLRNVYQKDGGPNTIKLNLVKFNPINDPIHLDPGDMAYWHLTGKVKWGFNEVKIEDENIFLNNFNIKDLIKEKDIFNEVDSTETKILKIRLFLSKIGKKEIKKFNSNITYYEDVILEPGDLAIIPVNCWHGYFSIGPRTGMTFRFE